MERESFNLYYRGCFVHRWEVLKGQIDAQEEAGESPQYEATMQLASSMLQETSNLDPVCLRLAALVLDAGRHAAWDACQHFLEQQAS